MINAKDEDGQRQVGGDESESGASGDPGPNDTVAWALRDLETKREEIEGAIEAILRSRPDLRKSRRGPRPS